MSSYTVVYFSIFLLQQYCSAAVTLGIYHWCHYHVFQLLFESFYKADYLIISMADL